MITKMFSALVTLGVMVSASADAQNALPDQPQTLDLLQLASYGKPMNQALRISSERIGLNEAVKSDDALGMEKHAMIQPRAPWQGVEAFDKGWLTCQRR